MRRKLSTLDTYLTCARERKLDFSAICAHRKSEKKKEKRVNLVGGKMAHPGGKLRFHRHILIPFEDLAV